MKALFFYESRTFFHNKKTWSVYFLLLFLSLFYWLNTESNYEPIEKASLPEIEARYLDSKAFLDQLVIDEWSHPSTVEASVVFPPINKLDKARVEALKKEDYVAYAQATKEAYQVTPYPISPLYYKNGNLYPYLDQYLTYEALDIKMGHYVLMTKELTLPILNDQTALQGLVRSTEKILPLIFIIVASLFSLDLFNHNRRHRSLHLGVPLSLGKQTFVKGCVALLGTILAVIPLSAGFIGLGINKGFGYLSLPVGINNIQDYHSFGMTIGEFLVRASGLILLFVVFIIGINLLLNLWVSHDYTLLFITLMGLSTELLYVNRVGYGEFHPIQWYPVSYLQVGQIITGYRGHAWVTPLVTYQQGVIVLSLCVVMVMLLLVIGTRTKGRM